MPMRIAIAALACCFALPSAAATFTWTGASSSDWSTASNWSPSGVPGAADTAVLPSPTTRADINLAGSTATVDTLQVDGAYHTTGLQLTAYTVAGAGTLIVDNVLGLHGGGTFSGTISGHGSIDLAGTYPAMKVSGALSITGGTGTLGAIDIVNEMFFPKFSAGQVTLRGRYSPSYFSPAYITGTSTVTIDPAASLETVFPGGLAPGTEFMLVRNDGALPISGTFTCIPEGRMLSGQAGEDYRISYVGGDGNDITATALPPARTWVGAGSQPVFSDPANWSPAGIPQPGDRLLFDGSTTTTDIVNDLPDGTVLTGMTVIQNPRRLTGNRLVVSDYVFAYAGFEISAEITVPGTSLLVNGPTLGAISGTGTLCVQSATITGAGSFSGVITRGLIPPSLLTLQGASLPNATVQSGSYAPDVNAPANVGISGSGTVGNMDVVRLYPSGITSGALTIRQFIDPSVPSEPFTLPFVVTSGPVNIAGLFLPGSGFAAHAATGLDIVLIRNDGSAPVNGMFTGLPEGASISLDGISYRMTYRGGDGNDVVLQWAGGVAPNMQARGGHRDLDGDGREDLVWSNPSGAVGAWTMKGLDYTNANVVASPAGGRVHAQVDFDGDGRTDILWRTPDGSYYASLMNGLSSAGPQLLTAGGSGWEVVGTGDFNGDGRADLLWRRTDGSYAIWLMNGTRIAAAQLLGNTPAGAWVEAVGDFDGDGISDLLWRDANASSSIWLMSGMAPKATRGPFTDASVDPPSPVVGSRVNGSPKRVAVTADLDGDRRTDIVWVDSYGAYTTWLMGGTAFQVSPLLAEGTGWDIAAAGDFDGNRTDDLVLRHADGRWAGWAMQGTQVTAGVVWLNAASPWSITQLRDLDGNGRADILLTHTDGSVAGWLMNGLSIGAGKVLAGPGTGWSLVK